MSGDDEVREHVRANVTGVMALNNNPMALLCNTKQAREMVSGKAAIIKPRNIAGPLAAPGIIWTVEDQCKVLPSCLVAGDYPFLVENVFSDYGTGPIAAMGPAYVSMLACLVFSNAHPNKRVDGFWHHVKHKTTRKQFGCRADVVAFIFKKREFAPAQELIADVIVPRARHQRRHTCPSSKCMSKLHQPVMKKMKFAPFSLLIFEKVMCKECWLWNLRRKNDVPPHISNLVPSSKQIMREVSEAAKPAFFTVMTTIFRVQAVAALDAASGIDMTCGDALEIHGAAVTFNFLYFAHVYRRKENAVGVTAHICPAIGWRQHAITAGYAHTQRRARYTMPDLRDTLQRARDAVTQHGRTEWRFVQWRCGVPHEFSPCVRTDCAVPVVQLWHEFLITKDNVMLSTEAARVWLALVQTRLHVTLILVPPLDKADIVPAFPVGAVSVRRIPRLRKSKNRDTACIAYPTFYEGSFLQWQWLAYMLRMHTLAAESNDITPVPRLCLTIFGSYTRAVLGEGYSRRTIQYGGPFRELVNLSETIFKDAVTVVTTDDRNSIMSYMDDDRAPSISHTLQMESNIHSNANVEEDIVCSNEVHGLVLSGNAHRTSPYVPITGELMEEISTMRFSNDLTLTDDTTCGLMKLAREAKVFSM